MLPSGNTSWPPAISECHTPPACVIVSRVNCSPPALCISASKDALLISLDIPKSHPPLLAPRVPFTDWVSPIVHRGTDFTWHGGSNRPRFRPAAQVQQRFRSQTDAPTLESPSPRSHAPANLAP